MLNKNKNFTPVPESPAFQSGDEWKSFWGIRSGVSDYKTKKPRTLVRGVLTIDKFYKLVNEVREDYFRFADKSSWEGQSKNPGYQKLRKFVNESTNILECGSGAGHALKYIWTKKGKFTGVEISPNAIKQARNILNKKNVRYIQCDIKKLPFRSNTFDLTYAVYTLEHVFNPDKVISEMWRVTKKGGIIFILSPNYGSPLEYSPSYSLKKLHLLKRCCENILLAFLHLIKPSNNLNWRKVLPVLWKTKSYFPDADTVNEPYLQTLIEFLLHKQTIIIEVESGIGWFSESKKDWLKMDFTSICFQIFRKICLKLGHWGILPFKYWGPVVYIVVRKL